MPSKARKTAPRLQPKSEDYEQYQALAEELGLTSVLELFRVFYRRYGGHLRSTWVLGIAPTPSAATAPEAIAPPSCTATKKGEALPPLTF